MRKTNKSYRFFFFAFAKIYLFVRITPKDDRIGRITNKYVLMQEKQVCVTLKTKIRANRSEIFMRRTTC